MTTDVAALVGSRICHDLISPIGAIGNGVELLALTDGDTGAEMDLISESVQNANARIRYFRIAFGAGSAEQTMGHSDIVSTLASVAQGGRFTYDWQVDGDQPRPVVRCAFLTLLCMETAMPMGGNVVVRKQGDSWQLEATGRRIKIDGPLWDSLTTPNTGFAHSAAQVQFALLPSCLEDAERIMQLDLQDDRIIIRF